MIVAWHEMPGYAQKRNPSRRVRYEEVAQASTLVELRRRAAGQRLATARRALWPNPRPVKVAQIAVDKTARPFGSLAPPLI
jgi:hypothetical protein